MGKDVIVACDFGSKNETINFLKKFNEKKPYVKIGMELFYSEGPDIVREIKAMGNKVFLDLKLHDIPNTVNKAMKSLKKLEVDMINVHAFGTRPMLEAAVSAFSDMENKPIILAVTQLTSTSEEVMKRDLLINSNINDVVCHYALVSKESGIDGVVCSPLEAGMVKKVCGREFITVTPGIRFLDSNVGDQVRVTTPAKAKEIGSDYIVVGRPITEAEDPVEAYLRCINEFVD